ncbi:PREDICTED: 60S ribosomal protein L39-like [Chrysochloris asiatica]|uniref:60S ribosomal protein L39-like n=1 Tax=Chrysochloris asiatica TaxID=185453 RepID=A0A9B0WHS2_CHRAS|nr:PREDICTED: 60S ribosomal protein L39-like [Chrysochloris asiatica]
MASHKTFRIKRILAKKEKKQLFVPFPQWIQVKTGNKIRYNFKRRHWRKTKLKSLEGRKVKPLPIGDQSKFQLKHPKIMM